MGKKSVSDEKRWEIIGLSRDPQNTLYRIAKLAGVSFKCVKPL